jgi:HAD superfamily hydrolase (TIGR01509 family)
MQLIPYAQIDTLFLDAGNTLISMDFDWIAAEIQDRGFACDPHTVRRAEAAARPTVSQGFVSKRFGEARDGFYFYLSTVLSRLPPVTVGGPDAVTCLVDALVPVIRVPGEANRLWRWVIPGVIDGLDAFKAMGLQLVVVSNSDGTVEQGLIEAGLRPYFDVVVDSTLVGFSKPDPRIFEHALATCGAHPSRVLHVGDMYHADVVGARGAGLHALLLDPFDDWGDVDCERLPDLNALAERLRAGRNAHADPSSQ